MFHPKVMWATDVTHSRFLLENICSLLSDVILCILFSWSHNESSRLELKERNYNSRGSCVVRMSPVHSALLLLLVSESVLSTRRQRGKRNEGKKKNDSAVIWPTELLLGTEFSPFT